MSEPTAGLRTGGWLSLGPASQLLGIDPDTLRRWADEGRVPAWTTPGGHRRFDADSLERLVEARRSTTRMPLTSLGASPERLTRVYRRHYASDERHRTRPSARRIAGRVGDWSRRSSRIWTPTRRTRDGGVASRRRPAPSCDDQARRLAASGATPDRRRLAASSAARQPFLAELAGVGRRRSLDPTRLAELYGDAWALLDRLLLRFIDAYQQRRLTHAASTSSCPRSPRSWRCLQRRAVRPVARTTRRLPAHLGDRHAVLRDRRRAARRWRAAAAGTRPLYRTWYLTGAVWTAGWLGLGTTFLLGGRGSATASRCACSWPGCSRSSSATGPSTPAPERCPLLYFIAAGILALAVAVETYFQNERWPMLAAGAVVGATVLSLVLMADHDARRPRATPSTRRRTCRSRRSSRPSSGC